MGIDEDFQALPGEAVLDFQWLVRITHAAYPYLGGWFALDFLSQQLGGINLDVHKRTPLLLMPAKAAHKARIAITAGVLTASIGIDRIGKHLRLGKNTFGLHFVDNHLTNF